MTGTDAITAAFRLIGVLASGETPTAAESTDALNTLIELIESWSTENLIIPNKVREVFPLVASQQTYTMGVGGNFNTSNPLKIEIAKYQVPGSSPVLELPMEILNQDEYAGVLLKTLTSTYPLYLYADGTYPLENISVWPVPNQTVNLVLYSWKALTNFSDLTTSVVFAPGYARMIKYNLAVALAPEYGKGSKISPVVMQIAEESKSNVKRMNTKPLYMTMDRALTGRGGTWNWMTGEVE